MKTSRICPHQFQLSNSQISQKRRRFSSICSCASRRIPSRQRSQNWVTSYCGG
ncbi:hypothetical protein JG687_00013946 [Phytophthora cactorum]|uniref:Uncharacterized protein n=1 Tax=Phytophthora cactorum TaxID=29920 RepID=A0A8T1TXK1_9STRA|nr:hypothetical protein JG687_00013946 [Phytophthora cactorum]